ncbi:MAG: response regulator [Lentisphaeria bacterium]
MSAPAKKILVVDDDELLREFYKRVLASSGYEVRLASNGLEAKECLNTDPSFALVIIDLLMPVCNGYQLIQYIRGKPELAKIPLLAVTGFARSCAEIDQIRKLCDGVMLKTDFELAHFTATIDRLTGGAAVAAAS